VWAARGHKLSVAPVDLQREQLDAPLALEFLDHLQQLDAPLALINAPDPTMRLGIRDRAMLQLALTAGLRVPERVGLRMGEVEFNGHYLDIQVRGK